MRSAAPGFVAELSKEARAGLLGAQLERAVILLEILWNFENRVYPLYRGSHLQSEFAPHADRAQHGQIGRDPGGGAQPLAVVPVKAPGRAHNFLRT